MQPNQSSVQRDDHLSAPAGCTVSDTSKDATGLLGQLGTLLACVQLSADNFTFSTQLSSHSIPGP